jgi:hypothetical protein
MNSTSPPHETPSVNKEKHSKDISSKENTSFSKENSFLSKENTSFSKENSFQDRFSELHTDIKSLRESLEVNMREMTAAITKLVRFEERQAFMMKAHEAAVKRSEKAEVDFDALTSRVETLEKDAPMQRTVNKWVLTAVYTIAASAVGYIGHILKFF